MRIAIATSSLAKLQSCSHMKGQEHIHEHLVSFTRFVRSCSSVADRANKLLSSAYLRLDIGRPPTETWLSKPSSALFIVYSGYILNTYGERMPPLRTSLTDGQEITVFHENRDGFISSSSYIRFSIWVQNWTLIAEMKKRINLFETNCISRLLQVHYNSTITPPSKME